MHADLPGTLSSKADGQDKKLALNFYFILSFYFYFLSMLLNELLNIPKLHKNIHIEALTATHKLSMIPSVNSKY